MVDGFAKVVSIIRKENKTPDQIAFLKMLLCKTKFFAQMFEQFKASPEIINGICAAVKLESYPKYHVLFQQGETDCTKAYVILRGTVLVCMRNTIDIFSKDANTSSDASESVNSKPNENQSIESQLNNSNNSEQAASGATTTTVTVTKNQFILDLRAAEQARRRSQVNRLLFDTSDQIEGILRENIHDTEFQGVLAKSCGKIIQEISEGSIFGEKALIEQKPRAASICTKTPCDFLILNKEDFEVIHHRFNKQQQEKKEFLLTMFPFLGTLVTSQRVFERVIRFFEEESFQKNAVIFREGEIASAESPESQKVYLITNGEVCLYRNAIKHISNTHVLHRSVTQTVQVATLGAKEIIGDELLIPSATNTNASSTITTNNNNNINITTTPTAVSTLSFLPIDMKYEYTAVCMSSSAQLFSVSVTALRTKLPDQITDSILHTFRFKQRGRLATLNEYKLRNQSSGNHRSGTAGESKFIVENTSNNNHLLSIDNYSLEKALLRKIVYHPPGNTQQQTHQLHRSNSSGSTNDTHDNNNNNNNNNTYMIEISQLKTPNNHTHSTSGDNRIFKNSPTNIKSKKTMSGKQQQLKSIQNEALAAQEACVDRPIETGKKPNQQIQSNNNHMIDIHGSSNTYDKFVLSELRTNFEEKFAKESGESQNEVIDSRDYMQLPKNFIASLTNQQQLKKQLADKQLSTRNNNNNSNSNNNNNNNNKTSATIQSSSSSTKLKSSRIQAYPFKIPPNPRYFQRLEEEMKSKNFQFADTKRILQATRALHFHQDEPQSIDRDSKVSPSRNDQLPSKFPKIPVESNPNKSLISATNLSTSVKDSSAFGGIIQAAAATTTTASQSTSTAQFQGKFHNVAEIKTHQLLKRVAAEYTPHEEYFAKDFNLQNAIEASAYNSKRLFGYYEQSVAAKDIVQSRLILSKSPEARRVNRMLAEDGHVSIPSAKHTLMNNHTHVNANYFYYKSNATSKSAGRLAAAAESSAAITAAAAQSTMMVLVASKQSSEVKCFQEQPNRDRSIVQLRLHSPIRQYIYQQNRKISEQNEAILQKRRAQQLADEQEENSRFKPYQAEDMHRSSSDKSQSLIQQQQQQQQQLQQQSPNVTSDSFSNSGIASINLGSIDMATILENALGEEDHVAGVPIQSDGKIGITPITNLKVLDTIIEKQTPIIDISSIDNNNLQIDQSVSPSDISQLPQEQQQQQDQRQQVEQKEEEKLCIESDKQSVLK